MSLRVKSVQVEGNGAAECAWRPRDVVIAGLLTAALLGVRVWRLDASCLWFDEVFSVHAAGHGWGALVDFVAVDLIHPPLFYLLLKSWIALVGSESVWWLRLFSVLTAMVAVVPVGLLCRELRLRPRVGQVALVLMAVSGFLIQHARDVRMYSLLLLFAAGSLWLLARFSRVDASRRDAVALFAVNLLLVYTHYYGWLLVGHELIFLLLWRRRKVKEFALMLAALVVCYSPWLWMLWQATAGAGKGLAQNIGWAVAPRVADIFQPYLVLHEPLRFRRNTHERVVLRISVWLALAVFVTAYVALGWRVLEQRRAVAAAAARTSETKRLRDERWGESGDFALKFLIFFSTAPVVFAFLLAHALPHSVWATRHLIIVAPAYTLLAAYALSALRPAWLATTIKLLCACWLALAAMLWSVRQRSDVPPMWCAWGTLAHQVVETEASAATSEIKIYATEDLVAYHLWYALSSGVPARSVDGRRFSVARIVNLPGLVEDRSYFLPRGFDEVLVTDAGGEGLSEEHFWAAFRDSNWNPEHPVLRLLSERGYEIDKHFEVTASGQKAFIVSARRRK
jgi:hypothetical protein